ncbi:MAG: hypothetical protein II006_03525 [Peptostreptococcaceae bacterium]|nr:hypothetical protein [Peptostreptococcaceae bacterium]
MAKNLIAGDTTTIIESGNDISVDLNTEYKDTVDSVGVADYLETTNKSDLVSAINEIYDDLYYKPGESYTVPVYTPSVGFLTGGNKTLNFAIQVPKSLKNISSISINGSLIIDIRIPAGGYIAQNVNFNSSSYTVSAVKINNYLLRLTITASSNFYGTNNICVAGDVHSGVSFVFS